MVDAHWAIAGILAAVAFGMVVNAPPASSSASTVHHLHPEDQADDVDEAQEEEKEGTGDVELTEQRVETGAGDPNARVDSRGHDGKAERGQREADGEGVGDKNSSEEELSKGAKEFLQKCKLKMTDKTWE